MQWQGDRNDAIDQLVESHSISFWRMILPMFCKRPIRRLRSRHAKYGSNVYDGKSWEIVVLEDFAQLRKAGLSNPLMDKIEKLLTSAG